MASDDPTEVVQRFCDAWEGGDLDHVLSFLSDGCVYHNIPMDPVVGTDAIRAFIDSFAGGVDHVTFEVVNIAATGNAVLTERIDRFVTPDKTTSLPVMGTFEVLDGRIIAWRDYFDLNQFLTGGADV